MMFVSMFRAFWFFNHHTQEIVEFLLLHAYAEPVVVEALCQVVVGAEGLDVFNHALEWPSHTLVLPREAEGRQLVVAAQVQLAHPQQTFDEEAKRAASVTTDGTVPVNILFLVKAGNNPPQVGDINLIFLLYSL